MLQFYQRQTINQSSIIFCLQNEKIHTIVVSTHCYKYTCGRASRKAIELDLGPMWATGRHTSYSVIA